MSIVCPAAGVFFGGTAFLGDFLALAGAWMAAGYMLVGRKLRSKMDLIPYIFVVYGMSAAHLGIPAISVTPEQAGKYVGFLSGFCGFDGPASEQITRDLLG